MLDKTLIKRDVLVRYCEQYGIEVVEDTEELAAAFEAHIHANVPLPVAGQPYPADYQVSCDLCGGDSSVLNECCPYCGSTGDEVPEAPDAKPAKESKAKDKKPKAKGKKAEPAPAEEPVGEPWDEPGSTAEPVIVTSATKAPKAKGKRSEAAKGLTVLDTPAPEADTTIDATDTGDRSPIVTTALVVRSDSDVVEEMATALHQAQCLPSTIDEAIAAVLDAKKLHVVGTWHFGRAILRCFEGDLWKQLRNDKGNPKYKGFAAFCESELKLASRYCYTLMEISAQFGAADVADIGVAKLGQILKVAPAQRAKLLAEARDGKPLSDIAKQVQALVKKHGASNAGAGKKDMSAARDAAAAKKTAKNADLITTTHEKRKTKVELFAKGAVNKDGTPKRAKRLADLPVGEELTLNGLTIKYSVTTDASGQLLLIVERVRPE